MTSAVVGDTSDAAVEQLDIVSGDRQRVSEETDTTLTSSNADDVTAECLDICGGGDAAVMDTGSTVAMLSCPSAALLIDTSSQKEIAAADTVETAATEPKPKHRKLVHRKLHRKQTCADTGIGGAGRKTCAWVTTKKLLLEPSAKPISVMKKSVEELAEEHKGVSCGGEPATEQNRLSKKSLSLRSTRKQALETVDQVQEMSDERAHQLAADVRVVVSDIKREPDYDCVDKCRRLSECDDASDDSSDGQVAVKETIIIASDNVPATQCSASTSALHRSLRVGNACRDYESEARRRLKDYDGTQSVDVEELFDECNMSELIDNRDVIEIDDDDEWVQMPTHIASVRSDDLLYTRLLLMMMMVKNSFIYLTISQL